MRRLRERGTPFVETWGHRQNLRLRTWLVPALLLMAREQFLRAGEQFSCDHTTHKCQNQEPSLFLINCNLWSPKLQPLLTWASFAAFPSTCQRDWTDYQPLRSSPHPCHKRDSTIRPTPKEKTPNLEPGWDSSVEWGSIWENPNWEPSVVNPQLKASVKSIPTLYFHLQAGWSEEAG